MNIDLITGTFNSRLFAGRVFGVTGAGHGIGEATTRGLCALGASVLAIDFDEANLRRVAQSVGDAVEPVVGDVTDPAVLDRALERIEQRFQRLDGWVNNAMINPCRGIAKQDEERFVRAFEVNLLAAWRIIKRIVPLLERQPAGSAIVNISSIMAELSCPGNAAYTSTKAGLEGLTRALAVELAPKRIRVNSISPGMVRTFSGINRLAGTDPASWSNADRALAEMIGVMSQDLQPWPDPGLPEHLAAAILFLLSPAAAFVSGADLAVDGAASAHLPALNDPRRLAAGQRIAELSNRLGDKRPGGHES